MKQTIIRTCPAILLILAMLLVAMLLPVAGLSESPASDLPAVGSIITFGHYEQDNHIDNGPEEIEWLVLDYDAKNNRALLISRYALDTKPYNTSDSSVTWETCTLRAWLNNDFLTAAFTTDEQAAIVITTVDNSRSQGLSSWDTNSGNNTQDRLFLLSCAEANDYFEVTRFNGDNTASRVRPTAYAIAQGAWTIADRRTADGEASGWWWLRSPGFNKATPRSLASTAPSATQT